MPKPKLIEDVLVFENGTQAVHAEVMFKQFFGFTSVTTNVIGTSLTIQVQSNTPRYLAFLGENNMSRFSVFVEKEANR